MMELSSAFSVQSACASQRSLRLRLRTREEAAGGCRTHIRGIRNRCGSSSCRASGTSGSSIARPRRLRQSHHRPGSGLVSGGAMPMGWRYWLAIRTYRRGPPCPQREGPHEAQAPRCTSCRRDCTSCPPVPGPSRGCSQAPVQAVVAVAVAAAGRSCGSLAQLAGPSWHHGLSGCRSHRQRRCGCTTRARPEPGSSTAEWRRGSAAPPSQHE